MNFQYEATAPLKTVPPTEDNELPTLIRAGVSTFIVTLNEFDEVTIIITLSPSCAEEVFKLS